MNEKDNLLQFQDYNAEDIAENSSMTYPNQQINDYEMNKSDATITAANFLKFDFYKKFFQIESEDVIKNIKSNPDLYGPIWICITLIISLSIFENIGNFIKFYGHHGNGWVSDFGKIPSAGLAILIYAWVIPSLLYVYVKLKNKSISLGYSELLCLYGYSLAIFIPTTFVCVVNKSWLQWIVLILSGAVSFVMVAQSIWPTLTDIKKIYNLILFSIILTCQILFVFVLKHFFIS
ncbi:unnamed protein product [Gordionus sp. m RMFG-2023]